MTSGTQAGGHKQAVAERFRRASHAYLRSSTHADGTDAAFAAAPAEAIAHFEIVSVDGVPASNVDDKILIRADRGR